MDAKQPMRATVELVTVDEDVASAGNRLMGLMDLLAAHGYVVESAAVVAMDHREVIPDSPLARLLAAA